MPDEEPPVTFGPGDYEAIEAAVMETTRGRWFLREYARRNRTADTEAVLAAVARLEKKIADESTARTMDRIRASLLDMAGAIEDTKADIAAPSPEPPPPPAGNEEAARRIARILETLRFLEGRIRTMIALCDGDEAPPEAAPERIAAGFAANETTPAFLN
ncbi:hypothetical protein [Microvirga thermotolerans]|uniref:Chemotaxis protein n=1 Tax=Microvirga thermotolerans TaxID=2651334 RepID=A0A5P9JY31_9HYPH|nr:hypothetical protein [Microvirga thermotolerans]QFU16145.1 hypothetical protein GDR74_07870 [Microvirga thermotolerans]